MTRTFWVAVGAVGGIAAYRRGTRAAARAKELGPLGTAQVAAHATSRLAARTANGLGRLNELKARREGRLIVGSAEVVTALPTGVAASGVAASGVPTSGVAASGVPTGGIPTSGVPAGPPEPGRHASGRAMPRTRRARRAATTGDPTRDRT